MPHNPQRPTAEQRAGYLAEATRVSELEGNPELPPEALEHARELFVAVQFLTDCLTGMGNDERLVDNACKHFLDRAKSVRDVWACFDYVMEGYIDEHARRDAWATTPCLQTVPEPTLLLTMWWDVAKRSVNDEGVYPQPLLWRGTDDDGLNLEALALPGAACYARAAKHLREGLATELVLGVDHVSAPGQGLELKDFLAVIWYVNGQFYTGVVEYQTTGTCDEPAFRPIQWDNTYWNNAQRFGPLPDLLKAVDYAAAKAQQNGFTKDLLVALQAEQSDGEPS